MHTQHNDFKNSATRSRRRSVLLTSTATALTVLIASSAVAQQADSSEGSSNTTPGTEGGLEEIVVTGVATHEGLKKLDTAYSVTSLSSEQIKELHPIASADLLKASPGVYVESSGGQTGENVEVAGFPSSGALPFGTVELNGVSLFPMSGQSYLSAPTLTRPDDTIERVELVQGGPSVLYGNGAPGLTVNSILKRGSDTPSGDIGLTYGSEGSERVDGFIGGALDKEARLYGSIGGYWSRSDGVRDPQYAAENDKQITATLSKDWDRGSLLTYARYENFKDQFVTDTPLLNPGTGKFSPYPSFSPLTGTMGSKADQYEQLQVAPCIGAGCTPGSVPVNMANGRGPDLTVFGAEFNWDFDHGLKLLDDLNYTSGTDHMVAFYSTSLNPEGLSAYIANAEKADNLPTSLAVSAYYTNTGAAASLGQNVLTQELRYMQQSLHSLSNEIHLSEELFPGNTLTVGNISAVYGVFETVYSGSDILLQAISNPTPIGINLSDGVHTWQLSSSQGFVNGVTGATLSRASGHNTAFFLSDSWRFGNWLLDAGARTERQTFVNNLQNTASGSLSGNPYELFNSKAQYFAPGTHPLPYGKTGTSWTAGLNYEFNPQMSAYVRVNEGVHFAAFSDLTVTVPNPPLETAHNFQVGYKYQNDVVYADLSAFYRIFDNVAGSGSFTIPGTTTTEVGLFTYGAKTEGLEYQLTLKPFTFKALDGFTVSMVGDYVHGTYDHSNGCVSISGITNETVCNPSYAYNGYLLTRQPTFQTRLTPAYALPMDWGILRTWVTLEYVGDHYGDMLEQQPLGTYYDLNIGMACDIGQHWEVNLFGTNMTNQIGLTEGNARINGAAATNGVILARSIQGREVSLQVKYKL